MEISTHAVSLSYGALNLALINHLYVVNY